MGCSASKLDDEEAVQLCKDRKRFIKEVFEYRNRFASGHVAYIQSLKRVSAALRDYVEGDEPREFPLDSFLTPIKKTSPGFITISSKTISPAQIKSGPNSTLRVNYLRSGGEPAVSVVERPQSPETAHMQTYSPMHHFGFESFFAPQPSPSNPRYFPYSPNDRPQIPPPSPQTSQWDFFWNPFSSLDYYGYPSQSSLDNTLMDNTFVDDDIRGLRQVREEEGIPDLEEETEQEECDAKGHVSDERETVESNDTTEEVIIEDVEDEEEEEEAEETDQEFEIKDEVKVLQSHRTRSVEVAQQQNAGKVEVKNQENTVDVGVTEEMPGFTVYVNRRPTSMYEVTKDLETHFMKICSSANEVSALLEVGKAQYSTSNELSAMKMLNPVALFRSASSRSSSSRFNVSASSLKDESYESSSDFSEDSGISSGGLQSILDRLYTWEKKLYEEVKSGEKVRIAYEKKRAQLRELDAKGGEPPSLDRTNASFSYLHTQIKVWIHSIEAISKRIETLRDEELQPRLIELVQGLSKMWNVMAESHQCQKRTLDEAKVLLAGTPSKLEAKRHSFISVADPQRLAQSAANLETEVRNWRACFESWISFQRSYIQAITGWLFRCVRLDPDISKLALSPRRSSGTLPIFGLCVQWSRFLDSIQEMPVIDGLDFFAAGMGSVYEQQMKDDYRRTSMGSKRFGPEESSGSMELVGVGEVEEVMTAEKMADLAIRVLCAGMSVAMTSMTEFAIGNAEGYASLVKQWENDKRPRVTCGPEK